MTCEADNLGCVIEATDFVLLARVEIDGVLITQADVASITWECFNEADSATLVDSGSLTVSTAISDTLIDNGMWDDWDTRGYNFIQRIAKTVCTVGGATYRVQTTINLTGGSVVSLLFRFSTTDLY